MEVWRYGTRRTTTTDFSLHFVPFEMTTFLTTGFPTEAFGNDKKCETFEKKKERSDKNNFTSQKIH